MLSLFGVFVSSSVYRPEVFEALTETTVGAVASRTIAFKVSSAFGSRFPGGTKSAVFPAASDRLPP